MCPAEGGMSPGHPAHKAAAQLGGQGPPTHKAVVQPGGLGRTRGAPHPPGTEPTCVRCGYPVPERPLGCRWPCANCGFLYPQGDCSD